MKSLIVKIFIGCLLTAISVKYAYIERGYIAIGGEWLVLPTFLLVTAFIRNWIKLLKEMEKK